MEILNKKRQTLEEMRKEFKGYCVCIIDCKKNSRGLVAEGIAILKDEWMDNVFDEFDEFEKKNTVSGMVYFKDFTDSLAILNSSVSFLLLSWKTPDIR